MPFGMVITEPVGLNRVELTTGAGTVLAARVASTGSPTITIGFPNTPGLTFTATQTITWTATDPDGDLLTYELLYSHDDGATWIGLDSGLTQTSYTLDFANLPGASGGRIKVMASDGFASAEDQSHNPFTVPDKGPAALILSPPPGQHFNGKTVVPLEGMGLDLEDGSLAGGRLSWQSDRDGALGTGQWIEVNLSPGLHNITLTATDSVGLTATATIQVIVDASQTRLYLPSIQRGN